MLNGMLLKAIYTLSTDVSIAGAGAGVDHVRSSIADSKVEKPVRGGRHRERLSKNLVREGVFDSRTREGGSVLEYEIYTSELLESLQSAASEQTLA